MFKLTRRTLLAGTSALTAAGMLPLQAFGAARAEHHAVAIRGECARGGFADSAARSGDEYDFVRHDLSPLWLALSRGRKSAGGGRNDGYPDLRVDCLILQKMEKY